ncbi:MAG: carboxypeptidase regulatory-like domain-containing protein [Vicinamibacterales bacterium]
MTYSHSQRVAGTLPDNAGRQFAPSAVSIAFIALLVMFIAPSASAQVSGGLTGTVVDAQGGVIPGATVTLINDARGTTVGTTVTNERGIFVIANIPPGVYTVIIEMPSFKTLKRSGFDISPGPTTDLGTLLIEVGGTQEVVTVTAETPLVQAVSGEKSFRVTNQQMESLPILGRDFSALLQLTPGVAIGTGLVTAEVQGGAGETNFMVDGLTVQDAGLLRQANKVSVEAISEVKALTSSYQAEFGRASGLQVNVVTKSGTNQFRGAAYLVARNSKWNSNSKTNILNGDPKEVMDQKDWGGSIGGPVGRPGGANKLFFFTNLEFNPRTRGRAVVSYRVPSMLERQGDFSQTRDQNGNLFPYIKDPLVNGNCSASDTTACFKDGGVLGRIPKDRLYQTGLNILKWWPEPNLELTDGAKYNYQRTTDPVSLYGYAPVIKLDYQATPNLRASFRYSMYQQPTKDFPNNIPGFTNVTQDNMGIWAHSYVINWTVNPTTFFEASYGRNSHHQEGCSVPGGSPTFCTGGISTSPKANRVTAGMGDLPFLFPDAFTIDRSYKAFAILDRVNPPWWDKASGSGMHVPMFSWGNRITNAPPNIQWPRFILDNWAQTLSISLTKVHGNHTFKAGYMFVDSIQTDGRNNMQGTYSFANNTANPLDTGFGFANAAVGVFESITQSSRWTEGRNSALNNDFYVQDNWKVKRNVTLDFGVRFVMQRPVYDLRGNGSNFLPETYKAGDAPALYQYGCLGAKPCSGSNRVAVNPVTGEVYGNYRQASVIVGTLVPGTGNRLNGLHQPGTDIVESYYKFPKLAVGPRWGAAWDIRGDQTLVLRGGGGVFYDRNQTQEAYTVVNNPPTSQTVVVRYGYLQNLGSAGLTTISPSSLRTFQYDAGLPSSVQWNGGIQMQLPLATALDVSYTGQHAWNKWEVSDINTIDIGAAFDPALQDPSLAPAGVASSLVNTNPNAVRFYKGYGSISHVLFDTWQTFHSIQASLTRRMHNGLAFGLTDTIALYDHSKVAPRWQHDYVNRTLGLRADQDEAQKLLGNNHPPLHQIKANFTYQLPGLRGGSTASKLAAYVLSDWQVSGIWTGISGTPYTIGYSYQSSGSNMYITGSPDYSGRVIIVGDPGKGSSSDVLRQFNTAAFKGPGVGSVGLESGNDYLYDAFESQVDVALNRTIRVRGSKSIQLRLDVFNLFNQATVTSRNTTMQLSSPSDPTTILNLPFDSSGNVIPSRATPRNAGFGVATGFQAPRSLQVQLRFVF